MSNKDIEILKEKLKIKDAEIEFRKKSEEYFENREEILMKELETYKKIAEKLAIELYITKKGDEICKNADHSKCVQRKVSCIECIIDWARKEIENG